MTADLRAALRDTATAWDALGHRAAQPECDRHPLVNPDDCEARARHLRALADAPPTVAELLPRVDEHAAYWTAGGVEWRAVHDVGAGPRVLFQAHDLREGRWITMHTIEDFFSAPARHAAVTRVTP